MAIKKSVFGSKAERNYYDKLARTWGDKYNIWHNLPYLNVFDTKSIVDLDDYMSQVSLGVLGYQESIKSSSVKFLIISEKDKNILKKTSIDYTVCNQQDEPILCIEFDGMGEGFNTGLHYHVQRKYGVPEYRKPWMELKLKVAHGSYVPYIVVGSKQFNDLHEEAKLTTVDALIGKVIAHQEFDKMKDNLERNPAQELGISEEEYNSLSDSEHHELVQDWILGREIEAELKHNPVQEKIAYLQYELSACNYHSEWEYSPASEKNISHQERIKRVQEAVWTIVTTHVKSSDPTLEEERATVELPNFKIPHVGMPEIIAEEIATLVALLRMKAQKNSLQGNLSW
jgi:hypothetical protein